MITESQSGNDLPSICFVAHLAYGALIGGNSGHVGGVERQMSVMAKWCAGHGYQATMLTWDEGQKDGMKITGVRVLKLCRENAGIKGLRFFWPKWTSLVGAMRLADADIYYHNCAEYVTGQVALWCRMHHRKFVYSIANDPDCDCSLPRMHSLRERVLYRYGLTHADKVIVQTRKQQEMLRTHFACESVVSPMPCPGPSPEEYVECERERSGSRRILWIGRICEQKRPDRLLELAEQCPDLSFDLVGPAAATKYSHAVCGRAKTLSNVSMHGPATRERVSDFYRQAKVMCCTSDFEGFPNTFLEAWSYGLPIVSTFDPDDLIAERGFGRVGKSIGELDVGIRGLLDSPEQWQRASQAAGHFYVEHHMVDNAMTRFGQIFLHVMDST